MLQRISTIIPVHNRPHTLRASVESVLNQAAPVSEILIVDDASTDNTLQVAKQLAVESSIIRVIALERNVGGGHARNMGIDQATAELIAFLDSDDVWHTDKLTSQLAAFRNAPNDLLCFSNLAIDYHDGTPARPWNDEPYCTGQSIRAYMLDLDQKVQTSTWLMPTSLARSIRFDNCLRRHQDIDFVLRADLAGARFAYIDRILVDYCADPKLGRVSQKKNADPSLNWLERATYLTPREREIFYLKHVLDMHWADAPSRALLRCARAVVTGQAEAGFTARTMARTMLPEAVRSKLKSILRRS